MCVELRVEVSSNTKDANKIIDGNLDTCWSPSGRLPHFILVSSRESFSKISLISQMGYNCKTVEILGTIHEFDEDTEAQIFDLEKHTRKIEIKILESWDPFGRICIYNLFLK